MTNGGPHWTFGPTPSGRRPPETGGQLRLLQRFIKVQKNFTMNKIDAKCLFTVIPQRYLMPVQIGHE